MHIAIVVPSLHGGGAESVAREWTTGLRAHGHPVTVYGGTQTSVDLPQGTTVHSLPPRGGSLRAALMSIWLRLRINCDPPDVVLSLLPFSNVIALLALRVGVHRAVPLMVSEHNVPSLQVANVQRRDRLTVWLARRLYRGATGVLAVSDPVAGELVSALRRPSRAYIHDPHRSVDQSFLHNPQHNYPSHCSSRNYGTHPSLTCIQRPPITTRASVSTLCMRKRSTHSSRPPLLKHELSL
jgi:glycosyltransferase involved in cell wall biosynthesis